MNTYTQLLFFICILTESVAFLSVGSRPLLRQRNGLVVASRDIDDDEMIVEEVENPERRNLIINAVGTGLLLSSGVASAQLYMSTAYTPDGFTRIPTQFIAALGDPNASQGKGTNEWGIWTKDPGPRGVWLRDYSKLEDSNYVAPVGWKFDKNDWWLEEHGMSLSHVLWK